MKSTGIIRKVDELGRIVLPIELRRTLDIAERDELEIYMESDRIILQKFEPACVFCGSSQGLISYRQKNICQECIRNMTDIRVYRKHQHAQTGAFPPLYHFPQKFRGKWLLSEKRDFKSHSGSFNAIS